ncbi:MAG: hypothetical protein HN726_04330 [Candidatus Magasanikbacteria bacterium]|jgi:hypothetical protein|nr:hypothetical protein [Candidatus Magasanikbacteria bacterium]MBT4220836.1 hypothetical protein [Candidatus Magasanikbacteria bacterium]MBT4350181.1 hypothetical protein [Candidatus Magasanikbacteria bacterium]MBT4541376.1 hypothetical protein [Candidatus Magasanikbacteria bacterium]MBT6253184.1 hypothetical protein [Candidatus Magasanikbacteria bacterium]
MQKTKKSFVKRLKIRRKKNKKTGKVEMTVEKRTCGQGHFNARESGKIKRNKRTDGMIKANHKAIKAAMPHSL